MSVMAANSSLSLPSTLAISAALPQQSGESKRLGKNNIAATDEPKKNNEPKKLVRASSTPNVRSIDAMTLRYNYPSSNEFASCHLSLSSWQSLYRTVFGHPSLQPHLIVADAHNEIETAIEYDLTLTTDDLSIDNDMIASSSLSSSLLPLWSPPITLIPKMIRHWPSRDIQIPLDCFTDRHQHDHWLNSNVVEVDHDEKKCMLVADRLAAACGYVSTIEFIRSIKSLTPPHPLLPYLYESVVASRTIGGVHGGPVLAIMHRDLSFSLEQYNKINSDPLMDTKNSNNNHKDWQRYRCRHPYSQKNDVLFWQPPLLPSISPLVPTPLSSSIASSSLTDSKRSSAKREYHTYNCSSNDSKDRFGTFLYNEVELGFALDGCNIDGMIKVVTRLVDGDNQIKGDYDSVHDRDHGDWLAFHCDDPDEAMNQSSYFIDHTMLFRIVDRSRCSLSTTKDVSNSTSMPFVPTMIVSWKSTWLHRRYPSPLPSPLSCSTSTKSSDNNNTSDDDRMVTFVSRLGLKLWQFRERTLHHTAIVKPTMDITSLVGIETVDDALALIVDTTSPSPSPPPPPSVVSNDSTTNTSSSSSLLASFEPLVSYHRPQSIPSTRIMIPDRVITIDIDKTSASPEPSMDVYIMGTYGQYIMHVLTPTNINTNAIKTFLYSCLPDTNIHASSLVSSSSVSIEEKNEVEQCRAGCVGRWPDQIGYPLPPHLSTNGVSDRFILRYDDHDDHDPRLFTHLSLCFINDDVHHIHNKSSLSSRVAASISSCSIKAMEKVWSHRSICQWQCVGVNDINWLSSSQIAVHSVGNIITIFDLTPAIIAASGISNTVGLPTGNSHTPITRMTTTMPTITKKYNTRSSSTRMMNDGNEMVDRELEGGVRMIRQFKSPSFGEIKNMYGILPYNYDYVTSLIQWCTISLSRHHLPTHLILIILFYLLSS
jgi:hypothetical protein